MSIADYSLPVFNTPEYKKKLKEVTGALESKYGEWEQPEYELEPPELEIVPEYSSIRLRETREFLADQFFSIEETMEYARNRYIPWVKQTEYVVVKRDTPNEPTEFKAFKASKRGNDVYAKRVQERWNRLYDLPEIEWFEYKDRSSNHKTRALFISLTYDESGLSVPDAWEYCTPDYNRFMARIRRKYGQCYGVRVIEAHKNGYPHIHVVLIFAKKWFNTFFYNGKWRVTEKRLGLEDCWKYGFSDIQGLSGFHGAVSYLGKYLMKNSSVDLESDFIAENSPSITTLSLLWIYRKRGFSISGKQLNDLICDMHNSNDSVVLVQYPLNMEPPDAPRWELCGLFVGRLMVDDRILWSCNLSRSEYGELRMARNYMDRSSFIER